ncbi:MAG: trypsin-like peptidase domain-containing protein [Chitinophagaceae bacterium]|nr:trypsin-like peptidase domain-containing protein [Chitinophagaceae bacterium]
MMLDAVERYIKGEMLPDERVYFEQLRKDNSEVDQLVVEHTIFLNEMNKFGERKSFKAMLHEVHGNLFEAGAIAEPETGRVVGFIRKYRRVISVAAFIAGITAIAISGLFTYFTPQRNNPEIRQLSQQLMEVKQSQKQTINEINRLKTTTSNGPALPGKLGGTGFMIDPKGYLVTSAHIVNTADSVYVENNKGDYFKATRVYVNNNTDVAILKIEDPRFQSFRYLPYNIRRNPAELGEKIFTLGFPRSEIVYNEGYLSAKTGYNGDTLACQLAISANPGNSGGPIFNNAGEVVGILSGKQTTAEGVVFSSKSVNIYNAIDELKKEKENEEVRLTPVISKVKGLDRVQQVKKLESCIYIVKSY